MRRLPFSFQPLLIFSHLINAFFHSFRTHCSNLPTPIVVDHGGYFGGATNMLICWKSTPVKSTDDYYSEVELLNTAHLVTPLISGTWPGSSTLWLRYGHLLEREEERILPIGYTTECCPQVECEHQLAPRTLIDCSCRHVREVSGNPGR